MAWKSGVRPRSRLGSSSSTSFSNGTSWCMYAPSVASRTRPSRAAKLGSPDASTRRTRVLTKQPMMLSASARVRPAIGVPTSRSVFSL